MIGRYAQVLAILDSLVGGAQIGAHGPFWRGLTVEQFISRKVFGLPIVEVGNAVRSNLIKALRAERPFGSDVGTPGAMYRRMPAGRQAATDEQIDFIARWINDGCPDDTVNAAALISTGSQDRLQRHITYWREFDDWAMFNVEPEVSAAINEFFPLAQLWVLFARDSGQLARWRQAISADPVRRALQVLSERQRITVAKYYGFPPNSEVLFESYKLFGKGEFPPDPLRPADPHHRMDGETMWFVWSAFADGCLRQGIDGNYWNVAARAILVGLLHDGIFRQRFRVLGFEATAQGSAAAVEHAAGLSDAQIISELAQRCAQCGLFDSLIEDAIG